MPELPDRPDIDQLRRQARELLRAAAQGEARAIARLRAVSGRITLSAAQLALAREYGYRSWPALKADVERRRLPTSAPTAPSPGGDERDTPLQRQSAYSRITQTSATSSNQVQLRATHRKVPTPLAPAAKMFGSPKMNFNLPGKKCLVTWLCPPISPSSVPAKIPIAKLS